MIGSLRRAVGEESGQVAVLVAVLFLALVFAVALVVNTGLLFVERRAAQEAADSAALSGAIRLAATGDPDDNGPTSARQAARDAAGLNGYGSGVTVNIPPLSGPNTGKLRFVEVLITTSKRAFLVPEWGLTAVNARAVAGGGGVPPNAIYSLGTGSGGPGLHIDNGGVLALYSASAPVGCSYYPTATPPWRTAPGAAGVDCSSDGGSAQVNSTSTEAGRNLGSPGGIIGPPSTVTQTYVGSGGSCTNAVLPDPKFPGASCANPTQSDPYFPYPKPVPASGGNWCRQDTFNSPPSLCAPYAGNISGCAGSLVLQPGVYTGVISGNCDYIFKPGVYVFAGDSNSGIRNPNKLRVLGNTPNDTFESSPGQPSPPGLVPYVRDPVYGACGSPSNDPRCGVLLFFTYTGYTGRSTDTPSGNGCAALSISGGNTAELSPEPTGTWQGMLVYYDNNPYCAGSSITLGGGAQVNGTSFRGLIYAPKANLVMQGNTSAAVLSQVVVNSINVQNALVVLNVGTAQVRVTGAIRLTE